MNLLIRQLEDLIELDPSNKDMFIELIDDASSKKFDCIFDSFSKAIEQVDSRTTD